MEACSGRFFWSCHSNAVSNVVCSQGGNHHQTPASRSVGRQTSSKEEVFNFYSIMSRVSGKIVHSPAIFRNLLTVVSYI